MFIKVIIIQKEKSTNLAAKIQQMDMELQTASLWPEEFQLKGLKRSNP